MRIPLSNFIQIKTSLTIFRAPLQRQKRNSVRKLKSRKPITERHVRSLVISEMETNKKEMENKIADGIENFSTSILAFIEVRLNDLEERLHAIMNRSLSSMRPLIPTLALTPPAPFLLLYFP
ncbi:hypothetical protein BWQ96_10773 [Gracilariopsis chorda]|uniref:Uncharacterized protein n=1 Tax=Gracilariopsis chorda TaxID=448386 RepID=A0A2V3IBM8_9FLOR|nr:hypothetical protein BWQ96_10773 [Gracilariopsis chorda]|eukprot:PXF39509.1 hypothetical protein BWQ96_10773 [Gracilariopsis chorda]